MDHRYAILREEKERTEKDAIIREQQIISRNENIQSEIKRLNDILVEKQIALKDVEAEIAAYKQLAEEKGNEILYLQNELTSVNERSVSILKDKRLAETDLHVSREGKTNASLEAESLFLTNKRLSQAEAEAKERQRDANLEVARLDRKLADISLQIEAIRKHSALKETELQEAHEGRYSNQREADILIQANKKLLDEKEYMAMKARELEIQQAKLRQNLDNTLALMEIKEKDLKNARLGLSYSEEKSVAVKSDLYKLKKENESLHLLLDKYRNDADFQKMLTTEEMKKKAEVAKEKEKLEREAMLKEYEARKAKEQLTKIQDTHEYLLDNKIQLNQELEALKEHTDLLESQNKSVSSSTS